MFHQAATTLLALALAGTALASPLHPLPPQARQDAAAAAPTAAIPADAEAAAAAANTAAKGGAQIFAGDTQNGLTTASGATNCAQTIVIFARGTTETGNVGTLTGPPFFQALAAAVGAGGNDNKLAVQGVDYAAAIAGFLAGGDPAGSKLMAQLAQKAVGDCPSSKVVISGYSQGGQLVHNAAAMLPADVSGKLAGAVIFGDPRE